MLIIALAIKLDSRGPALFKLGPMADSGRRGPTLFPI
jgi:lipopolysaccharide/colanic/teichoic acid biosynthesis glycosyltransferase